jgi:hypothetical protein
MYIGTKIIQAEPMTRAAYNEFRGWQLPADEDGADEGYLVEYLDGGKPNVPGRAGYVSWSPKAQFDAAYRPVRGMTFGLAIEALKKGLRVSRSGWNGKGMYLAYQQGYPDGIPINANTALATGIAEGTVCKFLPYLIMRTAQGDFVPWLASQTDVLAEDWELVA